MNKYSGLAIAVAWPDYIGKQTGSWYDVPMRWMGFNKNFHYQVGHAALILVNGTTGACYHFDCGRYHTPFQYGRIRDASTDSNLVIRTRAIISGKEINNLSEILNEIQMNKTCYGVGALYASYCQINFHSALIKVKSIQSKGAIPFGPFIINGTNCCRFVRKGILAGIPEIKYYFKLRFLWFLKPTPMGNIDCLARKTKIPEIKDKGYKFAQSHLSKTLYNKNNVMGTLPPPARPINLPVDSQWLSGEVAGGWFYLKLAEKAYIITRYSAEGTPECIGQFSLSGNGIFNINMPYSFSHLSHCNKVTIIQDNKVFEFYRNHHQAFTATNKIVKAIK